MHDIYNKLSRQSLQFVLLIREVILDLRHFIKVGYKAFHIQSLIIRNSKMLDIVAVDNYKFCIRMSKYL